MIFLYLLLGAITILGLFIFYGYYLSKNMKAQQSEPYYTESDVENPIFTQQEFKDIEDAISEDFKSLVLEPRKKEVIAYLKKVQLQEGAFKLTEAGQDLKVIWLFYYANKPLSFLFVMPCGQTHRWKNEIDRPELHLEDYYFYDYEDLKDSTTRMLERKYKGRVDENEYEFSYFWDKALDMERAFLVNCWQKAKNETNTNLIGFLHASDGSEGEIFLDTGENLWRAQGDISMSDYLKQHKHI